MQTRRLKPMTCPRQGFLSIRFAVTSLHDAETPLRQAETRLRQTVALRYVVTRSKVTF